MAGANSQPKPPVPTAVVQTLPPLAALLDKKAICERLNISPRTIENMVKSGTFPPPVRVGRLVYWSEIAVSRWQQRQFAAQEAWAPSEAVSRR